ncbi:MAG: aldo/keto reductase [Saprospiraceae bacterium]|nr:aldo/keto reductase [Saprospiraceae bacterium]
MKDRRTFLKKIAAVTSGLMIPQIDVTGKPIIRRDKWGELLPLRKLGKTGEEVTMLGVGGAHVGRSDERTAQEIIEKAMEGGVRFFDNAESYQNGRAERYYGKFLVPKYRENVFIMTKSTGADRETAQSHMEGSLRRMNVDYIDLWQIHSVRTPQDVDNRIENGLLDLALEAKTSGKVRHVGFTGHTSYQAHLRMLEQTDVLETCQMPINMFDPNYKSFIRNVLPQLIEKNVGVIAMKTLSNGGFFGGTTHYQNGGEPKIIPDKATIEEALHFVWSLPVSVLVTGAEDAEMLQEKIDLAKSFVGMDEEQRLDLIDRVAGFDGSKVEYYKS